jgi:hypothetical protein
MKLLPNDVYSKIEQLSKDAKSKLLTQGIVVPIKGKDGAIKVGNYIIKRKKDGFYCILDFEKEIIIDRINLPQTAAVVANRLALGKYVEDDIVNADTGYGYALFDEELHTKLAEKNVQSNMLDRADVMFTKSKISRFKKDEYMKTVMRSFNKLMRFN